MGSRRSAAPYHIILHQMLRLLPPAYWSVLSHIPYTSWIRDQLECTDPARNDFWELAGSLPVKARSRGRLGLRLGLLYSRKATALAGAECGARGVEPGLIRPETR